MSRKIFINATNHALTQAQLQDVAEKGFEVMELTAGLKAYWGACTASNWKIIYEEFIAFVDGLAMEKGGADIAAMIAGYAPLVYNCVADMTIDGHKALYADSKRESVEKTMEDGSVVKSNVFRHSGFYSQVTGERW